MSDESLLVTRQLRKSFGGVHAIDGVDFTLQRGELRCLIGPNGAGKSTFFKCLTGQLRPTSGSVYFEGASLAGIAMHEIARRGIGIKNQVPSVFEGLSARENLWIAARSQVSTPAARRVADELIQRLGLADFAAREVTQLSHGQRQWVEIAMVMARRPKLVLLDEPSAGMAQEEVARTAELSREINREASLIVVEHDMQFIRQLDAVVTVFHQGRILTQGRMDEIQGDERVRAIYLGARHDR